MISVFAEMGKLCQSVGKYYEIAIYGGSSLILAFDYRQATFDIDYVPMTGASSDIVKIAEQAFKSLNLPLGLLRDDVSIFVSDIAKYDFFDEFPKGEGNLRVFTASPEYIYSMKMLSMRSAMETEDLRDIWELSDKCGIDNIESAINILEKFYPEKSLPIRNKLLLEDIFNAKQQHKPYSREFGW